MSLTDAPWRKSSRSGGNGCVEVAIIEGKIAVRDSKDRDGPSLYFNSTEWEAFIAGVWNGEFDHVTMSQGDATPHHGTTQTVPNA